MHPPSRIILNNSHNLTTITVMDVWARLVSKDNHLQLLSLDRVKATSKNLLHQIYWKNIYQKQGEYSAEMGQLEAKLSVEVVRTFRNITDLFDNKACQNDAGAARMSGPILKLFLRDVSSCIAWTQRINTLALSVGKCEAKIADISSGKPKYSTIFKGTEFGAANERRLWLKMMVQYPSGNEIQFVPPICFLRLGRTELLATTQLAPIMVEILDSRPYSNDSCQDSGFISLGTKSGETGSTSQMSFKPADLLNSTIFSIKTEGVEVFFSENFPLTFSSISMADTLSKIRKVHQGVGLVSVCLARMECLNFNVNLDEHNIDNYPVLFPPTVWISGKSTLPIEFNIHAFHVKLLDEQTGLQPVTTRQVNFLLLLMISLVYSMV